MAGPSSARPPPTRPRSDLPRTFAELEEEFGPLYVRCDVCRRHVRLELGGLRDVDYRRKTFSCSVCGDAGALAIGDPTTERGRQDYRLDPVADPPRHRAAVVRLTSPPRRPEPVRRNGELPGRKIDLRR
jgi:hypothetical protein